MIERYTTPEMRDLWSEEASTARGWMSKSPFARGWRTTATFPPTRQPSFVNAPDSTPHASLSWSRRRATM